MNPARIAWVLLLLALGCTRTSDEPRAGGEPLSHWKSEAKLVSFFSFWNSEKDERRHEAFRRLVEIGEPAVPVLVELFLDEEIPITGDALNALCALGPRAAAAVPELARAVDESARSDAAWALGCIGPAASAAVPALSKAAQNRAPKLREAAAHALGQIGGSGREALERAAHDGDAAVRASAVAGLAPGGAGAPPPRDYLAAALEDPAPEVRARAFEAALPRSRDEAVQMAELVQRGMHDESELVREAARRWYTMVCQSWDSASLHARIVTGGDPGSRVEATWRLGSANLEHWHRQRAELSPEASAALAAALADSEPKVRIYAARGLSADSTAQARLAGVLRDAIAAPGADVHARVVGAKHLFPLSRDPRDVAAAYGDGLRADDHWRQLETLAAIREMGRDGAVLRAEIERVQRESRDPKVRDHASWLLTELADRSR
jgi:HEAT repeat protein